MMALRTTKYPRLPNLVRPKSSLRRTATDPAVATIATMAARPRRRRIPAWILRWIRAVVCGFVYLVQLSPTDRTRADLLRFAATCVALFAVSFLTTTLSGPDAGILAGLTVLYLTRNWWRDRRP